MWRLVLLLEGGVELRLPCLRELVFTDVGDRDVELLARLIVVQPPRRLVFFAALVAARCAFEIPSAQAC